MSEVAQTLPKPTPRYQSVSIPQSPPRKRHCEVGRGGGEGQTPRQEWRAGGGGEESVTGSFLRFLLLLLLPLTALYFFYTLHLLLASAASSSAASCPPDPTAVSSRVSTNRTAAAVAGSKAAPAAAAASTATTLQHVVFGIAASSRFWDKRKEYIKVWWRPRGAMRGYVWLDREPLFPNAPARPAAVRRLFSGPVKLDPAGIMQQSICYDGANRWTVSVAWGFAVLVSRGVTSPREMEMPGRMPARTFLNWYRRADYTAYAFNTRPLARTPCHKPAVYYLSSARSAEAARGGETTVTRYERWRPANETRPACRWNITDPDAHLDHIVVLKRPDPGIWDRSPRRNCCRVLSSPKVGKEGKKTMTIDVGVCRDGEFSQVV
uniref:Uncharacterized protein n=1 Tax=Aegilops tauschii TaxID=37682 RepID=M8ATP5_AEGTA